MWLKRLKILLFLILSVFVLGTTAVYVFQDKLIFQAVRLDRDYVFDFEDTYEEVFLYGNDNNEISAIHFKTSQSPRGVVIYFHGNADNLQRWGNYAVDFTEKGYDVLMVDYRGYGKSSGTPTEEHLYQDARVVWDWAYEQYKYDTWVIYGRSLGSAVASLLASEVTPDLLMLETPFEQLSKILPGQPIPIPLKYEFSNKKHLAKVSCKVIIIQGSDDWITTESSAKGLIPTLKTGDEYIRIDGGGHKNIRDFALYHQTLEQAL